MRELETLPGTRANKHKGHVREHLVKRVRLLPLFMFAFDGATTLAATGVSLRSKQADPFSSELTDDMGSFLQIALLRSKHSLTDLAESLSPGCSAPTHRDHWLVQYLVLINRRDLNSELQAITREPEREPEPEMLEGLGKQAKKLMQQQGDGRTDTRRPYRDKSIRKLKYSHSGFTSGLDITERTPDAATMTSGGDCLVRVPVMVQHFTRPLDTAIWSRRDPKWKQGDENPVLACFGLCIIHLAMRTLESSLRLMLKIASDRFVAGKGSDRKMIMKHLNDRVWADLKVRKLVSVDANGKLNRVTLNGGEVRTLIDDLLSGSSCLLAAITKMYASLKHPPQDDCTHMRKWAVALRHWALAMKAGYKLRATPADRQIFRDNIKLYVTRKAMIRAGTCCWYDWQCFSVMTKIFDSFGSLMAISQEGMEACQKRNNMLMRLGCNFANVGRIPWRITQCGREAVKAWMAERKAKKKSPQEWLWRRNLFCFYSDFYQAFERVEAHKKNGKTLDWKTQFSPEWKSCVCLTKIYKILLAKARWNISSGRKRAGRQAKQLPRQTLTWRRAEDGRAFKVPVYDDRRAALVAELRDYYLPCKIESSSGWELMTPEARARAIQRERKARWQKAKRGPLWQATQGPNQDRVL